MRLLASGQFVAEGMAGLDDPATTGYRLRCGWRDLEKVAGQPDFSSIINSAAVAAKHGKTVSLGIVLLAGAPQFIIDQCQTMTTDVGIIPKPWDATFVPAADAFTAKAAAALDGIPNLVYVAIGGLGAIMESRLEVSTLSAEDALSWVASSKHRIDTFGMGFKNTPFIMAYANAFRTGGDASSQAVANYGFLSYPKRFGVMACDLKVTSSLGYWPHQAMLDYSEIAVGGLQQLQNNDTDNGGPLADQLATALTFDPWFLEVYPPYFIPENSQLLIDTAAKLHKAFK